VREMYLMQYTKPKLKKNPDIRCTIERLTYCHIGNGARFSAPRILQSDAKASYSILHDLSMRIDSTLPHHFNE